LSIESQLRCAADLVQQGGRRAAVSGIVAMLDREVLTHDVLHAGTVGRRPANAFALCVQLAGDRRGDQIVVLVPHLIQSTTII